MGAPRIGTRVLEGTRAGVVVDHRPQGMVDVCFEDSGFVERRPANLLLAMNPAAKRAGLPAVRGKAAPSPETDLYDPTKEQFRAVVQGIYRSLVIKELGVPAFKDARGARADEKALKAKKVTQEDLRAILSRAYAIATAEGRKYGYIEEETQRPTQKGAALALARYGADPKLVAGMLKGDEKAQRLAAAKDPAKREENRQDYEVTLQLVRKGQTQRVVEEVVGGKLVSLQQPGAKRVARRRNVVSWEERGMARGMSEFPAALRPLLEEARRLGKAKGVLLRQLGQVRKEAARRGVLEALDINAQEYREQVDKAALDLLGLGALDDAGLVTAKTRRDLGVLRKVYEDIATDVQLGRAVRNPVKQRTKGIGIEGVGYHWKDVRTSRKEMTPTTLSAVIPANDPDRVGYFLLTFDSRNQKVRGIAQRAGGWVLAPQITSVAYETGVVRDAPKLHRVVRYTKGGSSGRGQSGQFAKGYYGVLGPRARGGEHFETQKEAEAHARKLDQRAASFLLPKVHEVTETREGAIISGPLVEEVIAEWRQKGNEDRLAENVTEVMGTEYVLYPDRESAEAFAAVLDKKAASRGALPIMGYRTKPGLTKAKAVERYNEMVAALADRSVYVTIDPSLTSGEAPSTGTRRFKRVAADPPGLRYVAQFTVDEVRSKPDTLFVFGDNMEREGKGGQAVIRDEANTLGIPTKWRPSRDEDAYFTDADFPEVRGEIDAALNTVEKYLRAGRAVALPSDGVGTGLAELPKRAPKIHAYITKRLAALKDIKPAVAASRLESRVITLPDAPTSARQRRLAERAPEWLVETLLARGEDPEQLIELVAGAEERGREKLVGLLAKSYAEDATTTAKMLATKKFGAERVSQILSAEREKRKIRAPIRGGFIQSERGFGEDFSLKIEKEASDRDVLLKALYPKGNVPPTMLPQYEKPQLFALDDDTLDKMAKKKLGLSDKEIEKIRTSTERTVLSRVVAEQAPLSGVELIARGGLEGVKLPKRVREKLEVERVGRIPGAKPVPRPVREVPPSREAPPKVVPKNVKALSDTDLDALIASLRKSNGALSTGLRLARAGGTKALSYGKRSVQGLRTWLASPAGKRFSAEASLLAVSLFGERAVASGKLTAADVEVVRKQIERRTGQSVSTEQVAGALHLGA